MPGIGFRLGIRALRMQCGTQQQLATEILNITFLFIDIACVSLPTRSAVRKACNASLFHLAFAADKGAAPLPSEGGILLSASRTARSCTICWGGISRHGTVLPPAVIFVWNVGIRWIVATEQGGIALRSAIFVYDLGKDGKTATLINERIGFTNNVCGAATKLAGP